MHDIDSDLAGEDHIGDDGLGRLVSVKYDSDLSCLVKCSRALRRISEDQLSAYLRPRSREYLRYTS